MRAIKGLIFIIMSVILIFNAWLAYMALFVSDAYLFGFLYAFISFGMGFMLYKIYNNGI